MTATIDAPQPETAHAPDVTVKRVSFTRLLHSEWIKLWSLRSTWWTLGSTVVVLVGFAVLFGLSMSSMPDDSREAMGTFLSPTLILTSSYEFASLVVAVLGAMLITGEYSTGMIRSTFAIAPGRIGAFAAKATVLALVTTTLVAASLVVAWLATYPMMQSIDMTVDFSDSTQLRELYGTVFYVVLVALFALGIGAIVRSTAGAIFSVVAVFLVIPIILGIVSSVTSVEWIDTLVNYLPSSAGASITPAAMQLPDPLEPWTGIGLLAGYTLVILAIGAFRLKRSDP